MAKKRPKTAEPIMEFFVKLVLDEKFRNAFATAKTVKARRALTKKVPSFKRRKPNAGILDALLKRRTGKVALFLGPNQQTAPTNSDAILDALESALATRKAAKTRAASKKR